MAKKLFIASTATLLLVFMTVMVFRCLSSFEFRKLEFAESGASRDAYSLFTRICTATGMLCRCLCYLYPLACLWLWFRGRTSLRLTLRTIFISLVLIAAMGYSVPFITSGRVDFASVNFFLFFCLVSFLQVFILCLIVGKVKKLF